MSHTRLAYIIAAAAASFIRRNIYIYICTRNKCECFILLNYRYEYTLDDIRGDIIRVRRVSFFLVHLSMYILNIGGWGLVVGDSNARL